MTDSHLLFDAMEDQMNKQACVINYREEGRLLGGSAADWSVLAGGILLAALFAAVFVL